MAPASLSYDSNDAYLTSPTYAVVLALAPNASFNAQNVANALNTSILSGATIPAGFQNLANLSGNVLNTAVNQLGGQPGGSFVPTGFLAGDMFLNMVLDPFVDGRDGGFGAAGDGTIASNESATPSMAAPALAYADNDPITARANKAFQAVWPVRKGPPASSRITQSGAAAMAGSARSLAMQRRALRQPRARSMASSPVSTITSPPTR